MIPVSYLYHSDHTGNITSTCVLGVQGAGGVRLLHLLGFGPSSQRIIEVISCYAGRPQEGNAMMRTTTDSGVQFDFSAWTRSKARLKLMGEILSRLHERHFRVVFFGDKLIQNEPVEDWPVCDLLIAFYSAGENNASS